MNKEEILNLKAEDKLENIKDLSLEDKVEFFKTCLNTDGIVNTEIISNIIVLLTGYTNIDDDLSDNKSFYFKSIDEYVDIKLQLTEDLQQFSIKLLKYYLGVLSGLSINLFDVKIHAPNLYFHTLLGLNAIQISKIFNKHIRDINPNEIVPVHNAEILYDCINNKDNVLSQFALNIAKELKLTEGEE